MTERPILIRRGYLFQRDRFKSWLWTCRVCPLNSHHSYTLLPAAYAAALQHLRDEHPGSAA